MTRVLISPSLCLPGDFAVLLKSGMTVRQAILYNTLSAMMAYLGMMTGILIGHYAENISMWVFALTAGLFMYVALVDMVSQQHATNALMSCDSRGLPPLRCSSAFMFTFMCERNVSRMFFRLLDTRPAWHHECGEVKG